MRLRPFLACQPESSTKAWQIRFRCASSPAALPCPSLSPRANLKCSMVRFRESTRKSKKTKKSRWSGSLRSGKNLRMCSSSSSPSMTLARSRSTTLAFLSVTNLATTSTSKRLNRDGEKISSRWSTWSLATPLETNERNHTLTQLDWLISQFKLRKI